MRVMRGEVMGSMDRVLGCRMVGLRREYVVYDTICAGSGVVEVVGVWYGVGLE